MINLGEELPCLDGGSGVGARIGEGGQSSSWEDCSQMCQNTEKCVAWTFHETSPFSCDLFSELESIAPKNFTVTGQMNCSDPSAVMVNEGINSKDLNPVEEKRIMKGVKIKGSPLGQTKRQEFKAYRS